MQFFRRNRSPASIGGHESTADPHHRYNNNNHHSFARNHDRDIDVFHAPAFASDPFRRLDSQQPAHSSLHDDDEPPEGRDHRHPAHRQLAAQQPTVSVVAPTGLNRDHSLVHHDAPSLDAAELDQSSVEHSWSSPSPRSSSHLDPEQQNHHVRQPAKLKKKNLFAQHSSSPSSSARDKSKGLGRSFSVKHNKPSSFAQHQQQQFVDRRRPSEPYLGFRQEHGVGELHSNPLMQQNTELDPTSNPSYGLQPAADPSSQHQYSHPPPHSPLEHPPSIQRVNTDPLDATPFHHDRRGESGDLTPSQVSSHQHRMPSYCEELQPPSPLHPSFQRDPSSLSHHPVHQHSNLSEPVLWHRRSPQPESSYSPARPSSQQFLEPSSSPLPPQQTHHSDLMMKLQSPSRRPSQQPSNLNPQSGDMAAADRASGLRQPQADSSSQPQSFRRDSQAAQGHSPYPGTPPGASFKGNSSQQNLQEHQQGRETPPSAQQSKSREDLEEVDVAALIQKHEELRMSRTSHVRAVELSLRPDCRGQV